MTFTVRHEQVSEAPRARVREYFSSVRNLVRVSPHCPVMTVHAGTTRVSPGTVFRLRLRFIVFAAHWTSVIERGEQDGSFTDVMTGGSFTSWRHTHRFHEAGSATRRGETVDDEPVWWFQPFSPLCVNRLCAVRRRKTVGERA